MCVGFHGTLDEILHVTKRHLHVLWLERERVGLIDEVAWKAGPPLAPLRTSK